MALNVCTATVFVLSGALFDRFADQDSLYEMVSIFEETGKEITIAESE